MIDLYCVSADASLLSAFCGAQACAIGPCAARAAVPAQEIGGVCLPAQAAAGTPGLFYACVRAAQPPLLPQGIALCAAQEGEPVVGGWL